MAITQDSNITGLRYAEEASLGVLPGSPIWKGLEPNSYNDFGGSITKVARNPINASRQRKKGVTTDLDASGGINTDVTQENLQDMLQSVFFADLRRKGEQAILGINGTSEVFEVASAEGFVAGHLIQSKNNNATANDGIFIVSAVSDVAATGVLTAASNPDDGDTVTIGSTVYTLQTTLTNVAGNVLIGVDASTTLDNLIAAINGDAGAGTTYAAATVEHPDVTAAAGTGDTMDVTAKVAGTAGNLIATSATGGEVSWGDTELAGGSASVTVTGNLTTDAAPPSDAGIVVVGVQLAAGDPTVDVSGALPKIVVSTADWTDYGLIPGEWIFIGGDSAPTSFANDENNGFARVRSATATDLTLDKTASTMVAENTSTETVRIFFGRVLKNEAARADQVRRTYHLERTLGPDADGEQSEYLKGSLPATFQMNVAQADKITADLGFVSIDHEQRTGAQGQLAGTRPTMVEADAFNTSSDFARMKLALAGSADAAPTALFAFLTELTITVDNNVTPAKAVSVLGAFDLSAGTFAVSASLTAYFSSVEAVQAVRNNSDVTLDLAVVANNAGFVFDLPLVALGDGRLNVVQDEKITLPLTMDAATAAKIDPTLDYTAMMVFFDYLPDAAG